MRVSIPGGRVKSLFLLENVLTFGEDGWADADHLTEAEVQRCRDFGFRVEGTVKKPDEPKETPVKTTRRKGVEK